MELLALSVARRGLKRLGFAGIDKCSVVASSEVVIAKKRRKGFMGEIVPKKMASGAGNPDA